MIGYKGNSFLEAGYVYSPYIPMYTTPTIILDDFLGRKGIARRNSESQTTVAWPLAA